MANPTDNLLEHNRILFAENWARETQQLNERLKSYVTVESDLAGERKGYDIMGARNTLSKRPDQSLTIPGVREKARNLATRRNDQTSYKRWIYAEEYDDATVIDAHDHIKLATLGEPDGAILTEMMSDVARNTDLSIIEAMARPVYVGKLGTLGPRVFGAAAATLSDGVTYPQEGKTIYCDYDRSESGVEDGTDGLEDGDKLGFTVSKIRKIQSIFGTAEVTTFGMSRQAETPVIALRQVDVDNLLDDVRITSRDFRGTLPFDTGTLESFLGVKFIHCERFSDLGWGEEEGDEDGIVDLFAWVPSGVKFYSGQWETYIDRLPENSQARQVYIWGRMGGLRFDPKKVIKVRVSATGATVQA